MFLDEKLKPDWLRHNDLRELVDDERSSEEFYTLRSRPNSLPKISPRDSEGHLMVGGS